MQQYPASPTAGQELGTTRARPLTAVNYFALALQRETESDGALSLSPKFYCHVQPVVDLVHGGFSVRVVLLGLNTLFREKVCQKALSSLAGWHLQNRLVLEGG